MCLRYTYGVHNIWGIRNGYRGFYSSEWEPLTPAGKCQQRVQPLRTLLDFTPRILPAQLCRQSTSLAAPT